MSSRGRLIRAILISAVVASFLTVLGFNLISAEKRIEQKISHRYGTDDPQFLHELGVMLGPPVVAGNRVVNLENGDAIFPAMLEAVQAAERTITFETYIYWSGSIGKSFADALSERARAGVKVHVLVDWVGSQKMKNDLVDEMKSAGVEIEYFHPLTWYQLGRINNRTHRKLLVVDGRIGFTGGVGIADQWTGNGQDAEHWRDTHYRLEGPAVAQMQAAFVDNWIKTTGEVLSGTPYFPALQPLDGGDAPAQVFTSSPSGGADSMMLMYLLAIAAAEHSIDLSAAYFVPDALTRRALVDARKRGVRVRVIVPGEIMDEEIVQHASRAQWGELLKAGIEIHEYQPTMFHCKMLIVDRLLVSVGSTNFDNRSFRLNEEANLNIYQRAFAERVTAVFEDDLTRAKAVSLAQWRKRPVTDQVAERLWSLFSSQL